MDLWYEKPAVKWAIVLACIVCVAIAAWQVSGLWRGPTPAVIDPDSTAPPIRWGRPRGAQEAQAAAPGNPSKSRTK